MVANRYILYNSVTSRISTIIESVVDMAACHVKMSNLIASKDQQSKIHLLIIITVHQIAPSHKLHHVRKPYS